MTVDLDRVVKLLNLTTSDNDNESLAAARAAEGKKSAMCYRYIGNKTRLTEWIVCEIGLQPASRADLASLVLTIGLILPMTMSLALSGLCKGVYVVKCERSLMVKSRCPASYIFALATSGFKVRWLNVLR